MAMEALDAMTSERERLATRLAEEQRKFGDLMRLRLDAARQERQLEVIQLITEGKKEEAIASVLRKDVMLFGMEVRFANDESLEKARQEWYEKGKADCMAAISKCTLIARQ
jgi:transcription elongation GreA/GreB family factor